MTDWSYYGMRPPTGPVPIRGRCPACRTDGLWPLPWTDRGVTRWTCADCPTGKDET